MYVEDVSVEAVFNKLGGIDGARRFLRGELVLSVPVRSWTAENGISRFSVTSDGATGPEWINWFDTNDYQLDDDAKTLLVSDKFRPTNGVTYQVCVLKGERYEDQKRITKEICADAQQLKLSEPPLELACLIRKMFTNERVQEMGLCWIVIMHKAVKLSGALRLLGVACCDGVGRLRTYYAYPADDWNCEFGFAFLASQVSS